MTFSIFLLTYSTVLAAEFVGDKSIYTVASLATRYRPWTVYAGISTAFIGKVLAAVLFGQAFARLPAHITAALSAVTFFATAVFLLRKGTEPPPAAGAGGGFAVSFAAVFFSEWADVGQIAVAALTAQYRAPYAIFLGGSLALMTKGLLALTLGAQLRRRIPAAWLRTVAVASCSVLGLAAVIEAVSR